MKRDRTEMPSNPSAERSVLAILLNHPSRADDIIDLLKTKHFLEPKMGRLFGSMMDRAMAGQTPFTAELIRTVLGDEAQSILYEISNGEAHNPATIGEHAKAIVGAWKKRQMIVACEETLYELREGTEDPDEVGRRLLDVFTDMSCDETDTQLMDMNVSGDEYVDEYGKNQSKARVSTGIGLLDQCYGGMLRGAELIVAAGRTSTGKTQFALQIVKNAAVNHKLDVLFVSLEMRAQELFMRYVSAEAMIDANKIQRGISSLNKDERRRHVIAIEAIRQWPITIFAPPTITASVLRATVRSWHAKHQNAGLIVVDYLQLLEAEDTKENRAASVGKIAGSLKVIARESDLPVLALCQLNRAADKPGEVPRLSHLRESGAVEQHCEKVWMIHRPKFEDEQGIRTSKESEQSQIIVAKHRNGPVGVVDVEYRQCIGFIDSKSERNEALDAWDEVESEL